MGYSEDKKTRALFGLIAIGVILAGLLFSKPAQTNPFTVLRFTDPSEPVVYEPERGSITVGFTVESHEMKETRYTYEIGIEYYGNSMPARNGGVKRGEFTLRDGDTMRISESLRIERDYPRAKLMVSLYKDGGNETYRTIQYWVNTRE